MTLFTVMNILELRLIVPDTDSKQFTRLSVPVSAVITFTLLVETSTETVPEAWAVNTFSVTILVCESMIIVSP